MERRRGDHAVDRSEIFGNKKVMLGSLSLRWHFMNYYLAPKRAEGSAVEIKSTVELLIGREFWIDSRCSQDDYFVLIADENLDVADDSMSTHVTISGSMCIENIRHRLLPDQERRMLALVRSANDSSRDIAIYNSRAHGFLPKAPIQRQRVLEMLAPAWEK